MMHIAVYHGCRLPGDIFFPCSQCAYEPGSIGCEEEIEMLDAEPIEN